MHVLGMTRHARQILAKSNIYSTFTQNVENTSGDDHFPPENPWESCFQGITTPSNKFHNVNPTTAHLPRPSRPRLLPYTSNHSMNPMSNSHQKPLKRQLDGPILSP